MTDRAYYHNGRVAWPINDSRIASLYLCGAYIPADGWTIGKQTKPDRDGWKPGKQGELRKGKGDQ